MQYSFCTLASWLPLATGAISRNLVLATKPRMKSSKMNEDFKVWKEICPKQEAVKWGRLQKPTPYRLMHGNGRRRRCCVLLVWTLETDQPGAGGTKWMDDGRTRRSGGLTNGPLADKLTME